MLSRKRKTVTAKSSQRTHHCLQGKRGTRRNPRTWNHIRNQNAPARRKRVERRSEARSKDACNLEVALNFFFAQKEIRSYQQAELQHIYMFCFCLQIKILKHNLQKSMSSTAQKRHIVRLSALIKLLNVSFDRT